MRPLTTLFAALLLALTGGCLDTGVVVPEPAAPPLIDVFPQARIAPALDTEVPEMPSLVATLLEQERAEYLPALDSYDAVARSGGGFMSDTNNLCPASARPVSPHLSVPADYPFHYENDPPYEGAPDNYNPEAGPHAAEYESDFAFDNLVAQPVHLLFGSIPIPIGDPVQFGTDRAIMAFNGGFGPVKGLLFDIIGPESTKAHATVYAAPGQWPVVPNSYDLEMEVLPGDPFNAESGTITSRFVKNEHGQSYDEMVVSPVEGPDVSMNLWRVPAKHGQFPFDNGIKVYRDQVTDEPYSIGFYSSSPFQLVAGTMIYDGAPYIVAGTSWIDRQFSGIADVTWDWVSLQGLECLDENDNVQEDCPVSSLTAGGFSISTQQDYLPDPDPAKDGNPVVHSFYAVDPISSGCGVERLELESGWTLEVVETWTSPRFNQRAGGYCEYATELVLDAPAAGLENVRFTAVVDDQEVWAFRDFYPCSYEGWADVVGLYNGQKFRGKGRIERFQGDRPAAP